MVSLRSFLFFALSSFFGFLIALVFWNQPSNDLKAGIDAIARDRLLLPMFVQGRGEILVACDPVNHILSAFRRDASGKISVVGHRDYTYDLMIREFPPSDPKTLKDTKPVAILKYLRDKQYKKDEDWLKYIKENKLKKKDEVRKAFRDWIRGRCRPSPNATRLLDLQRETAVNSRVLALWDDKNESLLLYEYVEGSGLTLLSARDISYDLGLGLVVKDLEVFFSTSPTVDDIQKQFEEFKKKRESEFKKQ